MGEAKRRKLARKKQEILGMLPDGTMKSIEVEMRYAGSVAQFLTEHRAWQLSGKAERNVPCNGCTACCHHHIIEVDPSVDDMSKLDVVESDGKLILRETSDGTCVHLGPQGCTVHAHRPRVCRSYDCRLFSLFFITNPHRKPPLPMWEFDANSLEERATRAAMQMAAMKNRSAEGQEEALAAASSQWQELLPLARQQLEHFAKLPRAQREALQQRARAAITSGTEEERAEASAAIERCILEKQDVG